MHVEDQQKFPKSL